MLGYVDNYDTGNICVWFETWTGDCGCTVWFPSGAAGVETTISQSEDTVSLSAHHHK